MSPPAAHRPTRPDPAGRAARLARFDFAAPVPRASPCCAAPIVAADAHPGRGQTLDCRSCGGVLYDFRGARLAASLDELAWVRDRADCVGLYWRNLRVARAWAEPQFVLVGSRYAPAATDHRWAVGGAGNDDDRAATALGLGGRFLTPAARHGFADLPAAVADLALELAAHWGPAVPPHAAALAAEPADVRAARAMEARAADAQPPVGDA